MQNAYNSCQSPLSRSNLTEVDVAGFLRVLLCFHLPLQQAIAVDALEREPVDVRKLARRFGFIG